jgi:electron transport complex protein RnfD
MWLIFGCAFLCVLQSALSDGGRSLLISLTALFFALMIEFLLTWRDYGASKIKDGSAAATAMILSLMLPNQINPVYAAFGAVFAVTVVKYSFGGLGTYWLNPALGGWLFIRFSWPQAFTNALAGQEISITQMSTATDIGMVDNTVTEFLNSSVFSFAGVQLPSGYIDLLFYNGPGIIADRGLFFLLIGTIFITAAGINRGWIPVVFLGVYGFITRFAGDLTAGYWNGDMLYGFFRRYNCNSLYHCNRTFKQRQIKIKRICFGCSCSFSFMVFPLSMSGISGMFYGNCSIKLSCASHKTYRR